MFELPHTATGSAQRTPKRTVKNGGGNSSGSSSGGGGGGSGGGGGGGGGSWLADGLGFFLNGSSHPLLARDTATVGCWWETL